MPARAITSRRSSRWPAWRAGSPTTYPPSTSATAWCSDRTGSRTRPVRARRCCWRTCSTWPRRRPRPRLRSPRSSTPTSPTGSTRTTCSTSTGWCRPPGTPDPICSTRTPGWHRCCARPTQRVSGHRTRSACSMSRPSRLSRCCCPATERSSTRSPKACSHTGSVPTCTTCPARCRSSTNSARCSSHPVRSGNPGSRCAWRPSGCWRPGSSYSASRPSTGCDARGEGPPHPFPGKWAQTAATRRVNLSPGPSFPGTADHGHASARPPGESAQRVGVLLAIGGQPGGTDDAGGVEQLGREDVALQVEQVQELVGVLAHPAAHHDQVWQEQCLHCRVVALQLLGPVLVGPALLVLHAGRCSGLGIVAVEFDMAELGVRDEHASIDDRAADPGAEGGDQDQTGVALGGAVVDLGDAGRVSVVHQIDVATQDVFELLLGLTVDPRLVDVGGRPGLAMGDHRGDRDPDRAVTDLFG